MAVRIRGQDRVIANLNAAERRMLAAASRGLRRGADLVLARSLDEVPILTGNLKASGSAQRVGELHAVVVYTADYAMPVHENVQASFNTGKARYLSDPAERSGTDVLRTIQREMRRRLRR